MKELITTEQWEHIKEFLPKQQIMGRPRVDDKKLLNGIMYVLKTGCRWEDMPSEYGNGKTANRRFNELEKINFFKKVNEKLLRDNHEKVELKKNINR
jgi:transposase